LKWVGVEVRLLYQAIRVQNGRKRVIQEYYMNYKISLLAFVVPPKLSRPKYLVQQYFNLEMFELHVQAK